MITNSQSGSVERKSREQNSFKEDVNYIMWFSRLKIVLNYSLILEKF